MLPAKRSVLPDPMSGAAPYGQRRIVVAVDEGEESLYALSWCLNNVVAVAEDNLVLVYAQRSRLVSPAIDATGYGFSLDIMASMDLYNKQLADAVMRRAKSLCADHPNVKVETRVEPGDPREVICRTIEELGADLLVMGSHGYGFVQRAFLGSVSNHCVQNVKCPVLIVKKPKQ